MAASLPSNKTFCDDDYYYDDDYDDDDYDDDRFYDENGKNITGYQDFLKMWADQWEHS